MRIWDLHPGYLDRKRLLGEHRELHGLVNIISQGKKGYARHRETLRWVGHLPALCTRHQLLVSEMMLRGYNHHSPVPEFNPPGTWPDIFIDTPVDQLRLLADKQADETSARIPIPRNTQQLWAQHKYSVMAHDPLLYTTLGSEVAHGKYRDDMRGLANLMIETMRTEPQTGRLRNALNHMWGYVSDSQHHMPEQDEELMQLIRQQAIVQQKHYLLESTALSELSIWIPATETGATSSPYT